MLVDAPNTQNALALQKILSMASLHPGTDYQMKEAGGTSARVAAMLKKKYAATIASGQTAAQARQRGLVKPRHHSQHLWPAAALRHLYAAAAGKGK